MNKNDISIFNINYSQQEGKVYESLEKSVKNFIKVTLPPPGAVNHMYKNWQFLISQIKTDKDSSDYIIKNSYPKSITKRRNGESMLHIYAKNSSIASFFKNNSEILIDNINILFKKVVVNKIKVDLH